MAKHLQSLTFAALALLLAWLPASSFAAGVAAPTNFTTFSAWDSGPGQRTLYFPSSTMGTPGTYFDVPVASGNRYPVATTSPPMIDTDGGLPRVTQSGTLKNPSGNPFTVSAAGRISAANTAKAVGKVLAQNLWPVVVGAALYDLFKEMGYDAVRLPDGSVSVTRPATNDLACQSLPLPAPRNNSCSGMGYVWLVVGKPYATTSCYSPLYCSKVASNWPNLQDYTYNGSPVNSGTQYLGAIPSVPSVPVTNQAFLDAVAAKSGWPSTSAISRVLADPAASQGEKIKVEPLSVTGPATSPGTQTVTQNTTNNTTKTETVTHNHTYEGAKVNTTTVTTTTVVNNTTGETVEQSTKTEAPAPSEPQITCGLPDTPICAVKVNEDNMPESLPTTVYNEHADKIKTAQDQALERMKTPGDTSSMFSGWNAFFGTPAMAACSPIVLPEFQGQSMGSLDPCPVVSGMREVMAYLWAAGGLFLCLGMIRQTAQGG